jgi:hypothetical protein
VTTPSAVTCDLRDASATVALDEVCESSYWQRGFPYQSANMSRVSRSLESVFDGRRPGGASHDVPVFADFADSELLRALGRLRFRGGRSSMAGVSAKRVRGYGVQRVSSQGLPK